VPELDWLEVLDMQLALANVHEETPGDWYRDPWNWSELDWLVPYHLTSYALPRLNASGVKATAPLDVPKENFAVRPAVVLDPLDRLLYQAMVDRLSRRLIGDLATWAYGWRLPRKAGPAGKYSRNDLEWTYFRNHLKALTVYDDAALLTDVVSFFGSIPKGALLEQIEARGQNRIAERLAGMVGSWYEVTGRGLPQRSRASAVLAHMYLRPVDDLLQQYDRQMPDRGRRLVPEGRAVRWMDDIWLFGRSDTRLREMQLGVQETL
jgi:hypothetical protein